MRASIGDAWCVILSTNTLLSLTFDCGDFGG